MPGERGARVSKRCNRTVAQKFSEIAQDLGFERKNARFTTVSPILGCFQFFCWFLARFVCAKRLNSNIGRAKKNTFIKSGPI